MQTALAAAFAALAALGLAGAASAQCSGYEKPAAQSAEAPPVVVEEDAASS
jgi:hypothetical protein